VATRDAPRMAEHATQLLAGQGDLDTEAREYLLLAAMSGHIVSGDKARALELWRTYKSKLRLPSAPAFRLLRCHASAARCENEFNA
jgi:hypothetical protein